MTEREEFEMRVVFMQVFECDPEATKESRLKAIGFGAGCASMQAKLDADKELLVALLNKYGFATGHGDSIGDLLGELEWQVQARVEKNQIKLDEANAKIAALEEVVRKSQWISVDERLPEYLTGRDYSENILGVCNGSLGVFARCYESDGWLWGSCYGDIDGEPQTDDEYILTHWMPLPEAPIVKEEK